MTQGLRANSRAWISRSLGSTRLGAGLKQLLRGIRFDRIRDFGPIEGVFPDDGAPPLRQLPYLDLAVIVFDQRRQPIAIANALLSRELPQGLVVRLSTDLGAANVRWLPWNQQLWDQPQDQPNDLGSSTRPATPAPFMSPYPASLFKLPLAYALLERVDAGELGFEAVRDPIERMITVSDNQATRELLQLLHSRGEMEAVNQRFRELGLGTIQIQGTDPATGWRWRPGEISMTALDTVKLLWLLDNGDPRRVLWHTAAGQPVRSTLSARSRQFLLDQLDDQALNEVLSTSNYGVFDQDGQRHGPADIEPGIPAQVPQRWIDPVTGFVSLESDGQLINYGQDVRPFNAKAADSRFGHKTGLTYNFGSDAGLVTALDGQPGRHYAVAFFSNLGYRYTDPAFAEQTSYPAFNDPMPVAYTQEIPRLGRELDTLVQQLFARDWSRSLA